MNLVRLAIVFRIRAVVDCLLAKLDNHPKNRNELAMILRTNPATKLSVRRINQRKGQHVPTGEARLRMV